MVLHVVATDSCSFLITDFFNSVHVTTGRVRRHLQPNQVVQVVQLLQEGTAQSREHRGDQESWTEL